MTLDQKLPVDWERFRTLAAGSGGVGELIDFYLECTREQIAAIDAAVDAGDIAAIELLAHRLAGSNAISGTVAIVQPLAELEQIANAGSLQGAADRVAEAREAFERIRTFLLDRFADERSHG